MAGIVVFDCGQKSQSLVHFLDDQEKHHGRRGGGYSAGQREPISKGVTSFQMSLSRG